MGSTVAFAPAQGSLPASKSPLRSRLGESTRTRTHPLFSRPSASTTVYEKRSWKVKRALPAI
jgi:hypothetical protein